MNPTDWTASLPAWTSTEWTYVVVAAAALVVYGLAVFVAWKALFKDRAKGRRRCPRCWHDLSHTPGFTCSECGFTAAGERQLTRTRRQWGRAVIAIAACVGISIMLHWRLDRRPWTFYVPIQVLVPMMTFSGEGMVHTEISRRITRNQLDAEDWARLMRHIASGDWGAEPGSEAWVDRYDSWLRRRRYTVMYDDKVDWGEGERETTMLLPPRIDMTTRSVWPTGAAVKVRFRMQEWWPLGADCRIQVTPRLEGATASTFYCTAVRQPWQNYWFDVDNAPDSIQSIDFDVSVDRALPDDGGWQRMSAQTLTLPTGFADSSEIFPEPVVDPDLDAAIAQVFNRGVVRWPSGPSRLRFYYNPQRTYGPQFADMALGVHVDLMHGDRLVRRLDIWWLGGPNVADRGVGFEGHDSDPELLDVIDESEQWVLRVTSDRELAMQSGDATQFWSGLVVVPLTLEEREGPAPGPRWWTDDDEQDPDSDDNAQ